MVKAKLYRPKKFPLLLILSIVFAAKWQTHSFGTYASQTYDLTYCALFAISAVYYLSCSVRISDDTVTVHSGFLTNRIPVSTIDYVDVVKQRFSIHNYQPALVMIDGRRLRLRFASSNYRSIKRSDSQCDLGKLLHYFEAQGGLVARPLESYLHRGSFRSAYEKPFPNGTFSQMAVIHIVSASAWGPKFGQSLLLTVPGLFFVSDELLLGSNRIPFREIVEIERIQQAEGENHIVTQIEISGTVGTIKGVVYHPLTAAAIENFDNLVTKFNKEC